MASALSFLMDGPMVLWKQKLNITTLNKQPLVEHWIPFKTLKTLWNKKCCGSCVTSFEKSSLTS